MAAMSDPVVRPAPTLSERSMAILEFDSMNGQMREMRDRSRQLLADIDAELAR